ncbi:MAG: hypothetical protein N3A38_10485 [Planctomycetota bacterium]|nr:hypothetical protein [Planctomycetota bacterium]
MPFTPFHMGPGILAKACLRGWFSLIVFGWAQIVMDIEPLLAMLGRAERLHGFTHTFACATLLAVFSAPTGRCLAGIGARILGFAGFRPIGWPAAFVGAFAGTYSHVALDAMIYADATPFAPFTDANPLLGLASARFVYRMCLLTGAIGAVACVAIWLYLAGRDVPPGAATL